MKSLITGLPGSTPIPGVQGAELLLDEILAYPLYPLITWEVKPPLDSEGAYQANISFCKR